MKMAQSIQNDIHSPFTLSGGNIVNSKESSTSCQIIKFHTSKNDSSVFSSDISQGTCSTMCNTEQEDDLIVSQFDSEQRIKHGVEQIKKKHKRQQQDDTDESSLEDYSSQYHSQHSLDDEDSESFADYGYDEEDADLKIRREMFLLANHDDTDEEEDSINLSDCSSHSDGYFGYCSSSCSEDGGLCDDSSTLSEETERSIAKCMGEMELESAATANAKEITCPTHRGDQSRRRIHIDKAPSNLRVRNTGGRFHSPTTNAETTTACKMFKKKLSFDTVELREYSVTVGAYSAANDSCPLTLDWKHTAERRSSLVEYERVKEDRERKRSFRERRSSCIVTCDTSRTTFVSSEKNSGSRMRLPRRLSIEERRVRIASVRRLSMEQVQNLERETLMKQIQGVLECAKLFSTPG